MWQATEQGSGEEFQRYIWKKLDPEINEHVLEGTARYMRLYHTVGVNTLGLIIWKYISILAEHKKSFRMILMTIKAQQLG